MIKKKNCTETKQLKNEKETKILVFVQKISNKHVFTLSLKVEQMRKRNRERTFLNFELISSFLCIMVELGGSGVVCLGAMVTPPVCLSVIASVLFHS